MALKSTRESQELFENTAKNVIRMLGGSEMAVAFLRQLQDEETFKSIDQPLSDKIRYVFFPKGHPQEGQIDFEKMHPSQIALNQQRVVLLKLKTLTADSTLINKINELAVPVPDNAPSDLKYKKKDNNSSTGMRDPQIIDLSVMQCLATLNVLFTVKDNTAQLTDTNVQKTLSEAFGEIVDYGQDTWVPLIYDNLSLELAKEYRRMLLALLPDPNNSAKPGIHGNDFSAFITADGFATKAAMYAFTTALRVSGKSIETVLSQMEKNADGDIKFYEGLELANSAAREFMQLNGVRDFSSDSISNVLNSMLNITTTPSVWLDGATSFMSRQELPSTELKFAPFRQPIYQFQVNSLSNLLKNEIKKAIETLAKNPEAEISFHAHTFLQNLQSDVSRNEATLNSEFNALCDSFVRDATQLAANYPSTSKQAFKKTHLENLIIECNKIKNDNTDLNNKMFRINNLFNTVVNQHKKDCQTNGQGLGGTGVLLSHTRGSFMDLSRKLNMQNDVGFHKFTQQAVTTEDYPGLYQDGTYQINIEKLKEHAQQRRETKLRLKEAEDAKKAEIAAAAATTASNEPQPSNQSPTPAEPTPPTSVIAAIPAPELEQPTPEPSTLPKFNKENLAQLTKSFTNLAVITKRLQTITEDFGTQYQAYNSTYEAYSSLTGWGSYFVGGTQAQQSALGELESLKQNNDKNADKYNKYILQVEEQLRLLRPLASTDEEKAYISQIKTQLQSLKDLESARQIAMNTLIANQEKKEGPQVNFKAQTIDPDPIKNYLSSKNGLITYSQEQHDKELAEQAAALAASMAEPAQETPHAAAPLSQEAEYRQYIEYIAYFESSKSPAERHMYEELLITLPFYSSSNKNEFIYADIVKRDLSKLPDSKFKSILTEIQTKSGLYKAIKNTNNAIIDAKIYDNKQPRKFFSWLLGRKPYDFTALEKALKTPFEKESVSVFNSFLSDENINRLKNNKSWKIQDFQAIHNITKHINSINDHLTSATNRQQPVSATESHDTNKTRAPAITPQRTTQATPVPPMPQATDNAHDELREDVSSVRVSRKKP